MVSLISRQPDQYRSELEPDETKRVQSFEGMLSPVRTRREQGEGEGTETQLTKGGMWPGANQTQTVHRAQWRVVPNPVVWRTRRT